MRTAILIAGWMWVVVALVGVTDTHTSLDRGFSLLFSGCALASAWGVGTLRRPSRRSWAWWSLPPAVLVIVVLSATEWGLAARVWLCEDALRARAEAARRGGEVRPGRAGFFFVEDIDGSQSEVRFVTGTEMLDTVGLAYRDAPPGSDERHYRHLFGPWYRFSRPY